MKSKCVFVVFIILLGSLGLIPTTRANSSWARTYDYIVKTKTIPQFLNFLGEIRRNDINLTFVFYPNSTVKITNQWNDTLIIKPPVLGYLFNVELYEDTERVAYRFPFSFLNKNYEVWVIFDFALLSDRVKVSLSGTLPIPLKLKIPLGHVGNATYSVKMNQFWVSKNYFENMNFPVGLFSGIGLDWSDIAQQVSFDHQRKILSIDVGSSFEIDPSIVASASGSVLYCPPQRKTFYGAGRYWAFYSNNVNMVYKSSTDGKTWSSETVVRSCDKGYEFSIWWDGTYVHYAWAASDYGEKNIPLYYRRGTPSSDGTITWYGTSEQIAQPADPNVLYSHPNVSVDSNGCPWIAYRRGTGSRVGSNFLSDNIDNDPYVVKSSTNDGTWSTASGFPIYLPQGYTGYSGWGIGFPVPLTNGKVYTIFTVESNSLTWYLKGRLWDDSSMGLCENITSLGFVITVSPNQGGYFSAVAIGDNVHVCYLKGPSDSATWWDHMVYRIRTYGSGWSGETTVVPTSGYYSESQWIFPFLSLNTKDNSLILFFNSGSDYCQYKRRIGGTWDSQAISWMNESAGSFATSVSYSGDDKICVLSNDAYGSSNAIFLQYYDLNTMPKIGQFQASLTTVRPGVAFLVNATISDSEGVSSLYNATVSLSNSVTLKWTASGNVFSEYYDPNGYCSLDVSGCSKTTINSTACRLSWKLELSSSYPTSVVDLCASVFDNQGGSNTGSKNNLFIYEITTTTPSGIVSEPPMTTPPPTTVTTTTTITPVPTATPISIPSLPDVVQTMGQLSAAIVESVKKLPEYMGWGWFLIILLITTASAYSWHQERQKRWNRPSKLVKDRLKWKTPQPTKIEFEAKKKPSVKWKRPEKSEET